ncbi:MAG: glycerol-3-phosphate 1-O-acyltransferase PlsY [Hyphomicrobiaceae bacterium]|nr:glycerol-3-phosphate 1-O-acyltransferase PlsY [Hyphomicrobiaceae bacterium]
MSIDLTSNISILAFIFGYLAGAIPFGLLLTKAFGMGDIRLQGSGNIGATNVLRTGNRWLAAATLFADMLKGTLPVLIGTKYGIETAMLAGLGAFIGHLFPVWLRFKGGKGVATYIGVLIGLYWPFALLFCGVWLIAALIFKISSLSALIATAILPLAAATTGQNALVFIILLMSLLVFFKHRDNIKRLVSGEEGQIGKKE